MCMCVCVCMHAIQAQSGSRKRDLMGGPDVGSGKEENKSGGREEGLESEIYMEDMILSICVCVCMCVHEM